MPQEDLKPGTLVRYDETTTRWYLGTVRKLDGDTVTLDYLGGYSGEVNRDHVRPFHAVLRGRERVLSLTRDDLCEVLFGQAFDRLTQTRLDEMQGLLRKHGLRFKPEVWPPDARIRIIIDRSFVASEKGGIDKELAALLPRWLQPSKLPPGSRDPLGFQGPAERLANDILPGLTVATTRIGYYGFIAWAVRRLNAERPPSGSTRLETFHRLERTLALCEFIRHGNDNSSCALLGQRSKTQVLQSAANDRFRVPTRILKNQNTAGAFRIYGTSLESNGFATQAPDLAADGLLPVRLTDLGADLARAFDSRVPDGFWDFATSDKAKDRDALRTWGKELCFARLGEKKYRSHFLDGFLLGGTADAERRHHTVRMLFSRGLLRDAYEAPARKVKGRDVISEDDLATLDDDEADDGGLTNREVLLRFYKEKPSGENARLQTAAVFELLSLAQTAIFAHIIKALDGSGRATIAGLTDAIVSDRPHGRLWSTPYGKVASKTGTAADLEDELLGAGDAKTAAAIGGALMARVRADPAFAARGADLAGTPVMALLDTLDPNKTLADSYAGLVQAMVERHEHVSRNKNRQRWCYLDADAVVKDDLRPLGYGWHAMRFPQLWSLCRDVRLTREEVARGR